MRGRGARSDASLRPATAAMGAGKSRAAGATPRVRARWGLPPGSAPLPSTAQTRTLAGRRRDAGRRARVLLVGKRVQAVPDLQQQGAARAPFPQLLPWSVALPLLRALPRRPHCGFAGRREVRALQGYGAPRRLARTWLPDLGRAAALRTAGRSGATRACCCSMYAWAWRALLLRTGPADFAEKLAQFCVSGAALGVAGLAPPPPWPPWRRACPAACLGRQTSGGCPGLCIHERLYTARERRGWLHEGSAASFKEGSAQGLWRENGVYGSVADRQSRVFLARSCMQTRTRTRCCVRTAV